MAGTTKLFKENEIIFKFGDPADSMYIVRKGTLKVFFLKGAEEVSLAILKEGAVVGEMAFFDNKPRSASVKSIGATECVEITRADFDKLLTQLPKWVVTMMQSLVTRLRQTNEKIQAVEASRASTSDNGTVTAAVILPNQKYPYQHVLRVFRILLLAVAKDGQKEGKDYVLAREIPAKIWTDFFEEEDLLFNKILETLQKTKFIEFKQDARKSNVIAFTNRGVFVHFVEFFGTFAKKQTPLKPFWSAAAVSLFQALIEATVTSGYDTMNVSFKNLQSDVKSKGIDTSGWNQAVTEIACIPDLKITPAGGDIMFRVVLKEHKNFVNYIKFIQLFLDSKLA